MRSKTKKETKPIKDRIKNQAPKVILEEIMKTDFSDPINRISRGQAIRLKCLDCTCGQQAEIRLCIVKTCPLWLFRMGNEAKAHTKA